MRSTPWYHQRRSESTPPTQRPRDPPSISMQEQDEATERLLRPTESALYRQSLYWKLDSFMDKGFHSWSKMDLFSDCKRCMWTPQGNIKGSCKIRPLKVSLPPLSGRSQHQMGGPRDSFEGGETCRSALQTPSTPSVRQSRPRHSNGRGHAHGVSGVKGQTRRSFPVQPFIAKHATHHSIGVYQRAS